MIRPLSASLFACCLILLAAGCAGASPRYRIEYSTYLGGSALDQLREILPGPDGSVLVAGQTASADMPATPDAFQPRYAGDDPALGHSGIYGGDAYLARLSPDGSQLLAATFFGGSRQERDVYGMALDRRGNVVITTSTRSSDVPVTRGAYQARYGGGEADWVAAKLSADLQRLLWCTYVGGTGDESPRGGLALDPDDNVLLVGATASPDFPTTPGAYRRARSGAYDAAVVKLKADGSGLVFSTLLGGSDADGIMGARIGREGEIHVGGHTTSTDFPVTAGAAQAKPGGKSDAFLAKLSAGGDRLLHATYLGGREAEFAEHPPALDPDGSVILTGVSNSPDFPTTTGVVQRALKGVGDGFVTRLSPDGRRSLFSTLLGGSGAGEFFLMPTRDRRGDIVLVGTTGSPDFPVTPDAVQPRYGGGESDGVLAILSADGSKLLYATFLGGGGGDLIRGVALGPKGEVYVTGSTTSDNFPTTRGAFQTRHQGGMDGFIAKLAPQ